MTSPRAILVAVSFSESSRVALVLAAQVARRYASQLHVVYAEDPLLDAAAEGAGIDLAGQTRQELQRFIAGAWPATECGPQTHVILGSSVTDILDAAHDLGADLLVVGGCGMSLAERVVFGSLTEGLLRQSDISVLVAPSAWMPGNPESVDLDSPGIDIIPAAAVRSRALDFRALAAATVPVLMQVIDLL